MGDSDFELFFELRMKAAEAYSSGDFAPLSRLLPEAGSVTFHSPRGDTVTDALPVAVRYQKDAATFQRGGTSRFEILQKVSSGDLGFWTGFQIASVTMAGKDKPMEMRIRITEVFKRLDGHWKMIHRHADLPRM